MLKPSRDGAGPARRADLEYAGVLLVATDGSLLLQLRDMKPWIAHPGGLSVFGGALEGTETAVEAAVRELEEETGLTAESNDLLFAAEELNRREDGRSELGTAFALTEVVPTELRVTEGRLHRLPPDAALADPRLTSLSRKAIEAVCPLSG